MASAAAVANLMGIRGPSRKVHDDTLMGSQNISTFHPQVVYQTSNILTVQLEPGMSYFEIIKYCDKLSRSYHKKGSNNNNNCNFLNGLGQSPSHATNKHIKNSNLHVNNIQALGAALVQSGGDQSIKKTVTLG
jgi:hypothetical protein